MWKIKFSSLEALQSLEFQVPSLKLIIFVVFYNFFKIRECYRRRSFPAVGQSVCSRSPSPRTDLPASPNRVDHSCTHHTRSHPSHSHPNPWSEWGGCRRRRGQWFPGGRGLRCTCLPSFSFPRTGEGSAEVGLRWSSGAHGGTTADPHKGWTLHHLHGQSSTSQWVLF